LARANDNLTPGSAGLSISYALQVTSLLNFMARLMSDLETNIVSVERLTELTETPQVRFLVVSKHGVQVLKQQKILIQLTFSVRKRIGRDQRTNRLSHGQIRVK
jgi:ABC-type multidrug transport system fused ATPase/permease subunit